ncbi:MAG: hypothetical protein HY320_15140 [Armatimonadetes bacterium]|nr:hypothetical protein [Armatimonadota bacterium]
MEIPSGVTVQSDTFDWAFNTRRGEFRGNVELESARARMTASQMTVQLSEEQDLQWATAHGQVVLTQKQDEKTSIRAEGDAAEYREAERHAELTGGVTIHYAAADLAEPAVMRGERAEMDLDKHVTVVHRTSAAPVTLVVKPLGKKGGPTPEPIDLRGDTVQVTGGANGSEYVVTGNPVVTQGPTTLRANRLRFQINPEDNQVTTIYAEGDVVFDGKGSQGGRMHVTGRNGVYQRQTHLITVTGDVAGRYFAPNREQPDELVGDRLVYDVEKEVGTVTGGPGGRAQVLKRVPPKKEEQKPATPDGKK